MSECLSLFESAKFGVMNSKKSAIKNEYAALKWNAAIEWLSLMFSKMRKKTERDMPKENIIVLILYWATVFKFNYLLSCFAEVMTQKQAVHVDGCKQKANLYLGW